jgi:hypothetical protein
MVPDLKFVRQSLIEGLRTFAWQYLALVIRQDKFLTLVLLVRSMFVDSAYCNCHLVLVNLIAEG